MDEELVRGLEEDRRRNLESLLELVDEEARRAREDYTGWMREVYRLRGVDQGRSARPRRS